MIDEPRCLARRCKHFIGASDSPEPLQVLVCSAFPQGIPGDIAYGANLHLKPFPGDNGIQYEEAPK